MLDLPPPASRGLTGTPCSSELLSPGWLHPDSLFLSRVGLSLQLNASGRRSRAGGSELGV
jgi:hypothetical protein